MPNRLRITGAAVLAAALLVACGDGGAGSSGTGGTGTTAAAGTGTGSGGPTSSVDLTARVKTFPEQSRSHVQGRVDYPQTPPVGGNHNPVWMNCGFYSQPVVTEAAVHSMEHGAVWIVWRPSLPAAQVDRIRALTRTSRYVLASPWADEAIPAPIVASAWGLQLTVDTAEDAALAAFVKMYAAGPQTPEPGAACSGAFGNPE